MARAFGLHCRVDENQKRIISLWRAMGVSVWHTFDTRQPGADVVIGLKTTKGRPLNILVEIKDGDKPLSQQALTDKEQIFHANWQGQIVIVRNEKQAIELIENLRTMDGE